MPSAVAEVEVRHPRLRPAGHVDRRRGEIGRRGAGLGDVEDRAQDRLPLFVLEALAGRSAPRPTTHVRPEVGVETRRS